MHLKKPPVMAVTRALPQLTIRPHRLQNMMAHSRINLQMEQIFQHQALIVMLAHLISITKDIRAVAGVIVAVECVGEASVAVVASAGLAETSPSAEAGEVGEAPKVAPNHST